MEIFICFWSDECLDSTFNVLYRVVRVWEAEKTFLRQREEAKVWVTKIFSTLFLLWIIATIASSKPSRSHTLSVSRSLHLLLLWCMTARPQLLSPLRTRSSLLLLPGLFFFAHYSTMNAACWQWVAVDGVELVDSSLMKELKKLQVKQSRAGLAPPGPAGRQDDAGGQPLHYQPF